MKRHGRDLSVYYLSETSQTEKTILYLIPAVWCCGKGKTMKTAKQAVVAQGMKIGKDE